LLAFFKGLSQGSEFLFCGPGRPLLLMSVSAERARRLLRLTGCAAGGAAGLLCPSSRIRLPWPRWPACPSAIRLGRSGSHHLRFAHGRGPRRRRPITEELGRDRTLGQDRETRLRLLAGQAPGHEIRSELPLGHGRQQGTPEPALERRRSGRGCIVQGVHGAPHDRFKYSPVALSGRPKLAPTELRAAEPVHRLNQGIQRSWLGHGRPVEGPHHRAGPRQPANFAGLGPLALLREPRCEGIARADEVPWGDIAEGIAGVFGRFGHEDERTS